MSTQIAQPFSPPLDSSPPPEPSWWPLLAVGLMGVCCLGGSVGAIILGIQQLQTAFAGKDRPLRVASAPGQLSGQPGTQPPDAPVAPLRQRPEVVIPVPQPLDPAKHQNEFRDVMRRLEAQFAPKIEPPAPLLPPEPPAPAVMPPPLGTPEQELPMLEFGPQDVAAIGPEIHGDHLFQDAAPAGGWLVGLRAVKGESWGGSILALQPIYQVGAEYQLGQQCGGGVGAIEHVQILARPGYAVGKIQARFGLIMNAVRVEFYRVDGQRLNPADAYASDWVGGSGGGFQALDGQGAPLVGLAGSFHPQDEVITVQVLRKKS